MSRYLTIDPVGKAKAVGGGSVDERTDQDER
jgi:hypothetical protein